MDNASFNIELKSVDKFDTENPPECDVVGTLFISNEDGSVYRYTGKGYEKIEYDETLNPTLYHIEKKKTIDNKIRYYLVKNEDGKIIKQIAKKNLSKYKELLLFVLIDGSDYDNNNPIKIKEYLKK